MSFSLMIVMSAHPEPAADDPRPVSSAPLRGAAVIRAPSVSLHHQLEHMARHLAVTMINDTPRTW
ncbi:MAG TPA: hypothetical protein ENJ83_00840 [Rhodospirillales bacterium]|nr:hypothetical protein [Rhodospirillales bacterium]